jgi:hypothetical protein
MLYVWNIALEEKASFDGSGADPNMPRELEEALLLTVRIIAARANIAPDEEPCSTSQTQSGSPISLDGIHARTPDLSNVTKSEPSAQMDLDSPSLLNKQETMHDGTTPSFSHNQLIITIVSLHSATNHIRKVVLLLSSLGALRIRQMSHAKVLLVGNH